MYVKNVILLFTNVIVVCYNNLVLKRFLSVRQNTQNLIKEDKEMASFGRTKEERQANMRGASTQLRFIMNQATNARNRGDERAAQGWEQEYRRKQRSYTTAAAAMRKRGEL